jgi:radical SAM protein with 4Fe4S-binding SPASM domain
LEAAGDPQLKVGSYVPQLEPHETKLEEWYTKDLVHLSACSNCKVRFICAGGCAVKRFRGQEAPDCKPILKEMKMAWNYLQEEVLRDISITT